MPAQHRCSLVPSGRLAARGLRAAEGEWDENWAGCQHFLIFFFFYVFRTDYLTINKNSVKHSFTLPKLLRTHMNRINGKDMGSKSAWLSLRDSHGTRCKANARKSDR